MGKKNKGKGKMVVAAAQDLDSFKSGSQKVAADGGKGAQVSSADGAAQASEPASYSAEERLKYTISKLRKDEQRQGLKDLADHYFYLDNKLIEYYCGCCEESDFSQRERPEILEEETFMYYVCQLTVEVEYVLSLPFVQFWAEITKDTQVMDFLDAFLLSIRKRNDVEKLQAGVLEKLGARQASTQSAEINEAGVLTTPKLIKQHVNKLLHAVLKVFYRLSKPVESDQDYFTLSVYQGLVYNNWLFDIAKLYDLIAIYGASNKDLVKSIVESVFENDKRYVQDFKDGVDTIINMLKRSFNSSLKVSDMINQVGVIQRTRSEQDDIIRRLMLDYVEIMSNVEYTTVFFPEAMLETVRSTSLPLFMANVYCLMAGPVKTLWMKDSQIASELNTLRQQVQKVAVETCLTLIDVAIIKSIGSHTQHYAVVQNAIASNLKQFILGVTGNVELSKEFLHRNSNFMASEESNNKSGCRFMRKVLDKKDCEGVLRVNFAQAINDFEDRFLDQDEKNFLMRILKSLAKGNLVMVKKVAPKTQTQSSAATAQAQSQGRSQQQAQQEKLNPQDKDNVKSIMEMFGERFERSYVTQVYLSNKRDFEKTLEMFITENLPPVEAEPQLTIIETAPEQPRGGHSMIDTGARPSQATGGAGSGGLDMRSYVLDEYKEVLFPKQISKYEKQHNEAMQRQKEREQEENVEVRKKILALAQMMQYDDDIEESNVSLNKMAGQPSAGTKPAQQPAKKVAPQKATATANQEESKLDELQLSDMDDEDLITDDPMAFIERQDSQQTDMNNLFVDDPKARAAKPAAPKQAQSDDKALTGKNDGRKGESDAPADKKGARDGGRDNQNPRSRGGRNNNNESRAAARDNSGSPRNQRGGRGGRGRDTAQGQARQDRRGRGGGDQVQSDGRRGGQRGNVGGGRGQGRGGYRDDYQRESLDKDSAYTSKNPLEAGGDDDRGSDNEGGAASQSERGGYGRGGNQRGGGRGGQRGGNRGGGGGGQRGGGRGGRGRGGNNTSTRDPHNQRNLAAKKQA